MSFGGGGIWNANVSVTQSWGHSWNPYAPKIAHLTKLKDLRQSAERAEIEGANSIATIRTLLLEHADLVIERDLAIQEFNQLADEHNQLVEKRKNLLNLKAQAETNMLVSYLNKPEYRVLQEALTVESARSQHPREHSSPISALRPLSTIS